MTTRPLKTTTALPLALAALLPTACANLQTRPGNPDSYGTGLWGGDYYASTGLEHQEWPTSLKDASAANASPDLASHLGGTPPPHYKGTDVPTEIWQARGATWNLHLKYLAASYKAGEVQDAIAIPLFGSAVATVALGIAKASTVAVAAAGLAGGTVAGGYKYAHPDADVTTDQTAAFALACVVDRSLPLRTLSVVPLVLDKASLQDAVDQLNIEAGNGDGTSAQQKATSAALDAAHQTMAQLDDKIAAYNDMPSVIFSTKNEIDKTAQTGGVRTLTYTTILSDLQAAAASKTANTQTTMAVSKAKQLTATDAAGKKSKGSKSTPMPTPHIDSITTTDQPATISARHEVRTALMTPSTPQDINSPNDASAAGSNELTATVRIDTLMNNNITTAQKVSQIAGDANEDLATRDYHIIAANIQGCPTGSAAAPLYTPPTTTPTTN